MPLRIPSPQPGTPLTHRFPFANVFSSAIASPTPFASPGISGLASLNLGGNRDISWSDRSSTASLPQPMQIPFYTLPKVNTGASVVTHSQTSPITTGGDHDNNGSINRHFGFVSGSSEPGSGVSSRAMGSRTSGSPRSGSRPTNPVVHAPIMPATSVSASTSSSSEDSLASSLFGQHGTTSSSSPASSQASLDSSTGKLDNNGVSLTVGTTSTPSNDRTNNTLGYNHSRPVSPFRAPQPPPTTRTPPSRNTSPLLSRVATSSSYPPPEPPMILPPDFVVQPHFTSGYGSPSTAAPTYFSTTTYHSQHVAPYLPFLSHAPPPADSYIEVETTPGEYRLNVRLPGFRRDGIMLATKRRRILHVVADRWEEGGGELDLCDYDSFY